MNKRYVVFLKLIASRLLDCGNHCDGRGAQGLRMKFTSSEITDRQPLRQPTLQCFSSVYAHQTFPSPAM